MLIRVYLYIYLYILLKLFLRKWQYIIHIDLNLFPSNYVNNFMTVYRDSC